MVKLAHPVLLRGAGTAARMQGPIILRRTEDNFVPALLDELGDADGLASALATRAQKQPGQSVLQLFQPIHRIYHLVLLQVDCDNVGYPRLDPQKIEGAGLVLRRRAIDSKGKVLPDVLEGWMREAPTPRSRIAGAPRRRAVRGWVRFEGRVGVGSTDLDRDPDPAHRAAELRSGQPELDVYFALKREAESLQENIVPLFVAPPKVCKAAGKTLLYGLVPVTSSEVVEANEPFPPYDVNDISEHLPQILKAGPLPSLPRPGGLVSYADVARPNLATVELELAKFVQHLRQIAIEFDAFGSSATSRALRAELDAIQLTFPGSTQRSAGAFLAEAVQVLLDGTPEGGSIRMPTQWASIDTTRATRIRTAVQASLAARLQKMVPNTGQFFDPTRQYQVRAFVRVRSENDCCAQLVWSDYSEPFTIAPWYTSSDRPPTVIGLPDVTDRNALKAMKPNVAFAVPSKLMDMLQANDPVKVLEGKGNKGAGGIGLMWICSFSLPIITLCAFIVLNIFLSLFDLIFRWMLYIKICIPVPKPK